MEVRRDRDDSIIVNSIDHSAWKARFEDASTRIQDRVRVLWYGLARDPARLQQVQTGLIMLLVLWSLSSVSQLIWIPFRANPIDAAPALALNPPKPAGGQQTAVIDTSSVKGLGLFGGSPEALADADNAMLSEASRDGIEQNARETRLALTLTGIVASTEDGHGQCGDQVGCRRAGLRGGRCVARIGSGGAGQGHAAAGRDRQQWDL